MSNLQYGSLSGPSTNSVSVSGGVNQQGHITGTANVRIPIQGLLSVGAKGAKELRFLPRSEFPEYGASAVLYIDTTNNKIYYWHDGQYEELSATIPIMARTTAEWNSPPFIQSQYGFIYIYTDYRMEGNNYIPAIKIGDGNAYVVDMPFFSTGVTEQDRQRWDNKVSAAISPLDVENLILSTD